MKAAKHARKDSQTRKTEKGGQVVPSNLPQEPATVKSAFWGTPETKKAAPAKKGLKTKGKFKRKAEKGTDKISVAGSNANRAERRRVKKERMKPSVPIK